MSATQFFPTFDTLAAIARVAAITKVYPFYLASRVKRGLVHAKDTDTFDDGKIIEGVGEIETIGDCRYALAVTDHNGTRYRITVEVDSRPHGDRT